ncbi:hypothetical protein I8T81_05900 [Acinetobacter seifertii]|uniref:Uncharacterized protein n=1 Tax=Acinetobacter seifertii TaxID=1530123 RepID=A0ABX8L3V0_9GAMM|nr:MULTISPECIES: hypothetical protein [Acinetobacter]MDS7966559.1 hypothetical protein [Acinetobacter sp. V117_2]QPV60352.1 hypothetical protein I8T81_05900 [Acinetobacter seifertii]QXB46044.1 hypothetical protein I6L30_16760 [Acinetobacter seifertii]
MSNVKVQFLTTCMHNRIVYIDNEVIEVEEKDADELLKLNLVKVIDSGVSEKSNKLTNQSRSRSIQRKSHLQNSLK